MGGGTCLEDAKPGRCPGKGARGSSRRGESAAVMRFSAADIFPAPPDVFPAPDGREEEGRRSDAQDGAAAACAEGPGAGPGEREVAEPEDGEQVGEGKAGGRIRPGGPRCGLCPPPRPGRGQEPGKAPRRL